MQTRDSASPVESFELERFLPYRLSLLTNTVSQGIAARYRDEFGISVTEWRILAVLGRFPGLTASEVVARTAMDKVAIHRGVKSLLEKRYLERRTDETDRRRRALHITRPKGQGVIENIIPRARQFERDLLNALTREEAAILQDILDKLQRTAERNTQT
jgi:DNA-binding MarR family transcriptional regulator